VRAADENVIGQNFWFGVPPRESRARNLRALVIACMWEPSLTANLAPTLVTLHQNVLLQVPTTCHGFPPELLANLSTETLDEPAVVSRVKPGLRRK